MSPALASCKYLIDTKRYYKTHQIKNSNSALLVFSVKPVHDMAEWYNVDP